MVVATWSRTTTPATTAGDLKCGRPPHRVSPRLRDHDIRRPRPGMESLAVRQSSEHLREE